MPYEKSVEDYSNEIEPLKRAVTWKLPLYAGLMVAPLLVTGCTTTDKTASALSSAKHETVKNTGGVKTYTYTARDKECLERAMFFESNRSSSDGLVAVGTVVMNRLVSGRYPETICGVVGQKNQFAPGVLSRNMNSKALPDVQAAADAVLKGKRHPAAKNSMFFHTAGLKFPYKNMHYVLVAGGNAFYEKRNRDGSLSAPIPDEPYNVAMAYTPQNSAMPDGESYSVIAPQDVPVPVEQPVIQLASVAAPPQVPQVSPAEQHAGLHPQTSLSFSADPKQVDAIGALLLAQDRPEPVLR